METPTPQHFKVHEFISEYMLVAIYSIVSFVATYCKINNENLARLKKTKQVCLISLVCFISVPSLLAYVSKLDNGSPENIMIPKFCPPASAIIQ